VNVARDFALCRSCERTFSFADAIAAGSSEEFLENPPLGAWYRETRDGFAAGASTRSPIAFFLVPFLCVWSGISLGGIYGTQIRSGHFKLIESLFGIPFLLGTVILGGMTLMTICGHVMIHIVGDEGMVFGGIGPIGWRRRFSWSGVRGVSESWTSHYSRGRRPTIRITGAKPFTFGSLLNEARREYLIAVLRRELLRRGKPRKAIHELDTF
jgi:hypothetical protein